MIADAKEIAGLTLQAEFGTECNDTFHTADLAFSDILIATPVAFTIPCNVIGCLNLMHDGRNAGHVILLLSKVILGFVTYLFNLLVFRLCR